MRKLVALIVLSVAMVATVAAAPKALTTSTSTVADPDEPVPHPDPAFLEAVPGGECTYDEGNKYEPYAWTEGRYEGKCKRIHFHFGPITVKPGQNDAPIQPVTIEKPAYDGYVVRFKPDLIRSVDGGHPATEDMHLHHATWLNAGDSYGSGPFFAAGEEKTIGNFPDGYGMEVAGDDTWLLLYMVHNATTQPEEVWIRYTIDYVAKADAEELGIKPIKPIWLDVQGGAIHEDAPSRSSYPVFNVQQGFGHVDSVANGGDDTGHFVCRWPDENCARYDSFGNVTPQQGTGDEYADIDGNDWNVPADLAGTLVALGGHLHPGGIRDEVALVRDGVEKDIHISDAIYWDHEDRTKAGGPPTSWNLSMTATSIQADWAVKIREGDKIRINAVQDSEIGSWYENMGIVVAFVVPEEFDDDIPSIDPFDPNVIIDRGYSDKVIIPDGPFLDDWRPSPCTPDLTDADGDGFKRLCLRGGPTHGAYEESANTGDCTQRGDCPALPEPSTEGPLVTEIHSVGFTYGQADMSVIGANGIPRVKAGEPIKWVNEDAAARIWHTFTTCEKPCTGATTVNYPHPGIGGTTTPENAADYRDNWMDFDSGNIGFGIMTEPTTSQIGGPEPYDEDWVRDAVYWEYAPTDPGVYTFYCRIHPGMRGAFEVIP